MAKGKKEKNHYSPVLANKHWCDDTSHYWPYEKNPHKRIIEGKKKGREQWGGQKRLYRPEVETALDQELETKVEPIYAALRRGAELAASDAVIWAQFLRSQFVRTPTFIRYENFTKDHHGIENQPLCDRVGCEDCQDLGCVLNRDWMLLVAHPEDYFVRTDNPVHYTGFLEDTSTVLYYPLHPRIYFVACSMPEAWDCLGRATKGHPSTTRIPTGKGGHFPARFPLCQGGGPIADPSIPRTAASLAKPCSPTCSGSIPKCSSIFTGSTRDRRSR